MALIDPNLLNKIRAIKTLRDRAGTDGEKDAAQNRLTIILAKHKLTESDIPSDSFSSRGRPDPTQHRTPAQPRQSHKHGWGEESPSGFWDSVFRKVTNDPFADFADIIRKSVEQEAKAREVHGYISTETTKSTKWQGVLLKRMGEAHGLKTKVVMGDELETWYILSHNQILLDSIAEMQQGLCKELINARKVYQRKIQPSNPNAFSRAFYESAVTTIYNRMCKAHGIPITHFRERNNNAEGKKFGRNAAMYCSIIL